MNAHSGRFFVLALCLAGAAGTVKAAPPSQAGRGRIDVTVDGGSFDLLHPRGSPRAVVKRCNWLGRGREKTGASCELHLGAEWQELWVEFSPAQDGRVTVQLQGEWYPQRDSQDIRLVWVDSVTVEGAALHNGDFEAVGLDGRPAGWAVGGEMPPASYSRDGAIARSGRNCLAVWHGGAARQSFEVRQGHTYRVRAWFRVLDPARITSVPLVKLQYPARTYAQEVQVELASPGAVARATVEIAPLYDDRTWAISSRWDDNNRSNLTMRDVLARHGHKATWYLNWNEQFAPTARELLLGGHSLGGHGLTHPHLTYLNRNRIFEETAGVRAEWEAAADSPVLSYAFSFCDFIDEQQGPPVQVDITRALERAGYYSIANGWYHDGPVHTEMILSPIMPWDGEDIDDYAAAAQASEWFRQAHPNLSFAMHVWYKTPRAWETFESQLDSLGGKADWWYCNQNQYAAYRYQYLRTKLDVLSREGRTIRLRLDRPELLDLNDAVPLTLRISGVTAADVRAVRCASADCAPSSRQTASPLFHLSHDRDRMLPAKIGIVRNTANAAAPAVGHDADEDFPDVAGWLHWADGQLRLALANRGDRPLTNVQVTYRLPLAWENGIVRRTLGDLAAGATARDTVTTKPAGDAASPQAQFLYASGEAFYVAQVDFVRAGLPGRLHVCCTAAGPPRNAACPQGGFTRLGPIAEAQYDQRFWMRAIRAGGPAVEPVPGADGRPIEWVVDDDPAAPPHLSPEVIRTTGQWDSPTRAYYVLQSTVVSPAARPVEIVCPGNFVQQVFLNGRPTTRGAATLMQGANHLVLIYRTDPSGYHRENAGCFLRLADPNTGVALSDIRYEPVGPAQ